MNTSVVCPEGAFMVWKTSACSSKSQMVHSQSILVFTEWWWKEQRCLIRQRWLWFWSKNSHCEVEGKKKACAIFVASFHANLLTFCREASFFNVALLVDFQDLHFQGLLWNSYNHAGKVFKSVIQTLANSCRWNQLLLSVIISWALSPWPPQHNALQTWLTCQHCIWALSWS